MTSQVFQDSPAQWSFWLKPQWSSLWTKTILSDWWGVIEHQVGLQWCCFSPVSVSLSQLECPQGCESDLSLRCCTPSGSGRSSHGLQQLIPTIVTLNFHMLSVAIVLHCLKFAGPLCQSWSAPLFVTVVLQPEHFSFWKVQTQRKRAKAQHSE